MKKILLVVFLFITISIISTSKTYAYNKYVNIPGYEKIYFKSRENKLLDFYISSDEIKETDYKSKEQYERDLKEKLRYQTEKANMRKHWFGLKIKKLNTKVEIKFIKQTLRKYVNDNMHEDKIKLDFQTTTEHNYKYNLSGTIAQQADLSFPAKSIVGKLKTELKISEETTIQKNKKIVEKMELSVPKQTKFTAREVGVAYLTNGVFGYSLMFYNFTGDFQIIEETSSYYEYVLESI